MIMDKDEFKEEVGRLIIFTKGISFTNNSKNQFDGFRKETIGDPSPQLLSWVASIETIVNNHYKKGSGTHSLFHSFKRTGLNDVQSVFNSQIKILLAVLKSCLDHPPIPMPSLTKYVDREIEKIVIKEIEVPISFSSMLHSNLAWKMFVGLFLAAFGMALFAVDVGYKIRVNNLEEELHDTKEDLEYYESKNGFR